MNTNTGAKRVFEFRGDHDSQQVVVCQKHSKEMPCVDHENVFTYPADDDCECTLCRQDARQ